MTQTQKKVTTKTNRVIIRTLVLRVPMEATVAWRLATSELMSTLPLVLPAAALALILLIVPRF